MRVEKREKQKLKKKQRLNTKITEFGTKRAQRRRIRRREERGNHDCAKLGRSVLRPYKDEKTEQWQGQSQNFI